MRYPFNLVIIEKILIKICIILVISICFINIFPLNVITSSRNEYWYNTKINEHEGRIDIRILGEEDISKILVTINGKPLKLKTQSCCFSIIVKDSDIIEVSGDNINIPSIAKIEKVTQNILSPSIGTEIDINNRIQLLTKVRLK